MLKTTLFNSQENNILYLVGGIPTPLENVKISWDDEIPNINGKIKVTFQSQPTRSLFLFIITTLPINIEITQPVYFEGYSGPARVILL